MKHEPSIACGVIQVSDTERWQIYSEKGYLDLITSECTSYKLERVTSYDRRKMPTYVRKPGTRVREELMWDTVNGEGWYPPDKAQCEVLEWLYRKIIAEHMESETL